MKLKWLSDLSNRLFARENRPEPNPIKYMDSAMFRLTRSFHVYIGHYQQQNPESQEQARTCLDSMAKNLLWQVGVFAGTGVSVESAFDKRLSCVADHLVLLGGLTVAEKPVFIKVVWKAYDSIGENKMAFIRIGKPPFDEPRNV